MPTDTDRDQRIPVMIVDDHDVVAQGLAALLDDHDRIDVIGRAATCAGAIELATQRRDVRGDTGVGHPERRGGTPHRATASHLGVGAQLRRRHGHPPCRPRCGKRTDQVIA